EEQGGRKPPAEAGRYTYRQESAAEPAQAHWQGCLLHGSPLAGRVGQTFLSAILKADRNVCPTRPAGQIKPPDRRRPQAALQIPKTASSTHHRSEADRRWLR